jgi:Zn-finger nucleic acid-binding protein
MQCPVCTTGLQITERQGIDIDYCPQCRGVWLDRGELEKLIERSLTVSSSAAWGGQRHAGERAERPAEHGREDDERSRPQRRRSFLSELFDVDERLRDTQPAGCPAATHTTTEGSQTHVQRVLHFYSNAGV